MTAKPVRSLDATCRTGDGSLLSGTLLRGGGRRPRIVLVHSLAMNRGVWNAVLPLLTVHADVLAYDCRGHGVSDRRPGVYTTHLFADDLACMLDAVDWTSAVLVGCSMGGLVIQDFAATYPQRSDGLVLIDTTAWYGPDAPTTWRERAQKAQSEGFAQLVPFQVTRWFGEDFRARRPDIVMEATEVFVANDHACYAASCRMLGDADLRALLGRVAAPATVIVGSEDYATPPTMAEDLATRLGAAPPLILQKARHLTPLERPHEIAESILAAARFSSQ